ncbi:MAG: hypothetical protein N3A58_04560 [Spirochaetes bacterium]|nr:hypothetical protein [Spirochaetota bacterium]
MFTKQLIAEDFESIEYLKEFDFKVTLFLIFLSFYEIEFSKELISTNNKNIFIDPEFIKHLKENQFFEFLEKVKKNSSLFSITKYLNNSNDINKIKKELNIILESPLSGILDIIKIVSINLSKTNILYDILKKNLSSINDNKDIYFLQNLFISFEKAFNLYNKTIIENINYFQNENFKTNLEKINKINFIIIPFYKSNSIYFNNNIEILNIEKGYIPIFSYKISFKQLLYEMYLFNLNNHIKEIGLFSKIINLDKNERERYFDLFKRDFYYPDFEFFSRNLFLNYILEHFSSEKLKNFISNKLYYIKYTPINIIFDKWSSIEINNDIPFPRTFGNKIIEIIRNNIEYKTLDYKNIFSNEKDTLIVFISDLHFMQNNKYRNYLIIKKIIKYISKKFKRTCIDFFEYKNNLENYNEKKIIYFYFINKNKNSPLNNVFNINIEKDGAINYNNYLIKNYSLITINFENSFSVLLLSDEDYSIAIRLINNVKNIFNGDYKIKKRNIIQKIFDKIIFLLIF